MAADMGNSPDLEMAWAMKAHCHAETYSKLISTFDPSKLKLTNFDDHIYRQFKRFFKNVQVEIINENDFKSEPAKTRWRPFCELYKHKIENYNFGTLLRIDCNKDYSEDNSILVTRIQFFAVEIARNRRRLNKLHLPSKTQNGEDIQER